MVPVRVWCVLAAGSMQEHVAGSDEGEDKHSQALPRSDRRFCHRASMIERGCPPPMVVAWERGRGGCCVRGCVALFY